MRGAGAAPEAGGAGGLRGAGSHPASHPHSHALHQRTSAFVFLARRRDPKTLPGSRSFPFAPAQTPKTLGSPPISLHPETWTPWGIKQAAPCRSPALGFAGFSRAARPPGAAKVKANPWEGRWARGAQGAPSGAILLGRSQWSSLGTGAIPTPGCPSAPIT